MPKAAAAKPHPSPETSEEIDMKALARKAAAGELDKADRRIIYENGLDVAELKEFASALDELAKSEPEAAKFDAAVADVEKADAALKNHIEAKRELFERMHKEEHSLRDATKEAYARLSLVKRAVEIRNGLRITFSQMLGLPPTDLDQFTLVSKDRSSIGDPDAPVLEVPHEIFRTEQDRRAELLSAAREIYVQAIWPKIEAEHREARSSWRAKIRDLLRGDERPAEPAAPEFTPPGWGEIVKDPEFRARCERQAEIARNTGKVANW